LGSTGGNVTKSYAYDAFGNEKNPDPNDTNLFRYCGEYYDSETGTYYLRNRHYRPLVGSFTQEDAARDGLNWYVYCGGNPIRYIDPSGFKRIDTAYTYTTYKLDYSLDPDFGRAVVDQRYPMTKVEFTKLNVTLYTMDGVSFHTDPEKLLKGEHLWIDDPTNLMRRITGPGEAGTLANVEKMDKAQGWKIVGSFGKTTISFISDATLVYGWFAKAAGSAGSTGVKIISNVGKGADVISYSWSATESVGKLSQGELRSFNAFLREASGYLPFYGTYKEFESALKNAGYKVTFVK